MERVNIGCGMTPTPGWRNFDNSPSLRLSRFELLWRLFSALGVLDANQRAYLAFCRGSGIEYADAAVRIPMPDGSAEVIYASHMLEHLDQREAQAFIGEVRRVLAPGGILRLAVPDLAKHVEAYQSDGDADAFVGSLHVCMPKPVGVQRRVVVALAGARHHLWMYDGPSLCRMLDRAGFLEPQVFPPGETSVRNPGELNLRERQDDSVYVEATRP